MKKMKIALLFILTCFSVRIQAQDEKAPLSVLLGHGAAVNSIDVSCDDKYLISASKDETIRIWNLTEYKSEKTITGLPSSVKRVQFNPACNKFMAGFHEDFYEFGFPSLKTSKKKKQAHDGFVETVGYSNDGKLILTTGWRTKTIIVWKYKSLKKQIVLEESEWTDNACFNGTANWVLSGAHDNKVKLWDVSTGKLIRSFAGHDDWVYMVKFSKDEKKIYSSSLDKTIKIWDVESGKNTATLKGHLDGVIAFDISADGNYLVSAGMDKQIIIWDLRTNAQIEKFLAHSEPIFSIKISRDGKRIFSAGKDNAIKVWSFSPGT